MVTKKLEDFELFPLIDEICDRIKREIIDANRVGELEEVLKKYEIEKEEYYFCEPRIAKILVIGQTQTSIVDLKRVIKKFKNFGIDEDRFEFVLNYEDSKNYPMESLRYNQKYSDIFIGPIPHKTNGMGDCSSILAKIKKNPGEYPKMTELKDSNGLKITKNSFEEALKKSQLLFVLNND